MSTPGAPLPGIALACTEPLRRSTGEAMTVGLASGLTPEAGVIPTGIEVPLFAS